VSVDGLLAARLQDIGCVACRKDGRYGVPSDLHHPTSGGRRLSDDIVIPLCPFHHRNVATGWDYALLAGLPTLATNKRAFFERYGTEAELLAYTNELLAQRPGGGL
jgi:hypothetical protein